MKAQEQQGVKLSRTNRRRCKRCKKRNNQIFKEGTCSSCSKYEQREICVCGFTVGQAEKEMERHPDLYKEIWDVIYDHEQTCIIYKNACYEIEQCSLDGNW